MRRVRTDESKTGSDPSASHGGWEYYAGCLRKKKWAGRLSVQESGMSEAGPEEEGAGAVFSDEYTGSGVPDSERGADADWRIMTGYYLHWEWQPGPE